MLASSLLTSSLFCQEEPSVEASSGKHKKILILSSKGGYGHTAAANTLLAILKERYEIEIVHPIDNIRFFGVPSGEEFYNTMLHHGWIRSMSFISRYIAPPLFRTKKSKIERIIHRYIEAQKPDLIISLIPFINYPASEAARKQDIPYLLVTTDNDLKNWVLDLDEVKHPHFKVTIGSDLPTSKGRLVKQGIPESSIETIGLPLRPEFRRDQNAEALRESYEIPQGKHVVLIMMGGSGCHSALEYAKKIAGMDVSVHLIVVAGKNKKLAEELRKLSLHPSNSLLVMGFTDKVAELMSISDLIITKPGPGTINEAITLGLPILIDNTGSTLFWERANIDLVCKYGIGGKIKESKEIKNLLMNYLQDEQLREKISESFNKIPPNLFHEKIVSLVDEMCHVQVAVD
jgi:processive 1,2-diacylglycerol beta-glucosyltransferase